MGEKMEQEDKPNGCKRLITATAPAMCAERTGTYRQRLTAANTTPAHAVGQVKRQEVQEMPDMPQIKVISTKRACEILAEYGMDTNPNKLGLGLQQKIYPFGVAIKATIWIYEIYERKLLEWIMERAQ